eukprot:11221110-Lingulodinium_polyedra.AAC.1
MRMRLLRRISAVLGPQTKEIRAARPAWVGSLEGFLHSPGMARRPLGGHAVAPGGARRQRRGKAGGA